MQKDWISVSVNIPVGETPLNVSLRVPGWPVKPQVMLPTFQQLANTIADFAEKAAADQGYSVSCRKGCGACCRQPVPLTEVEIHFIALLVAQQPEPKRTELVQRFNAAAAHFQNNGWLNAYTTCEDKEALQELVRAYFSEKIPCPFLEDECCTIHQYRPIACREYLVTSDPIFCAEDSRSEVRRLPMAATLTDNLARVGRSRQFPGNKSFLPLVFALAWAQQFPETAPEKTGVEWLGEFFG